MSDTLKDVLEARQLREGNYYVPPSGPRHHVDTMSVYGVPPTAVVYTSGNPIGSKPRYRPDRATALTMYGYGEPGTYTPNFVAQNYLTYTKHPDFSRLAFAPKEVRADWIEEHPHPDLEPKEHEELTRHVRKGNFGEAVEEYVLPSSSPMQESLPTEWFACCEALREQWRAGL